MTYKTFGLLDRFECLMCDEAYQWEYPEGKYPTGKAVVVNTDTGDLLEYYFQLVAKENAVFPYPLDLDCIKAALCQVCVHRLPSCKVKDVYLLNPLEMRDTPLSVYLTPGVAKRDVDHTTYVYEIEVIDPGCTAPSSITQRLGVDFVEVRRIPTEGFPRVPTPVDLEDPEVLLPYLGGSLAKRDAFVALFKQLVQTRGPHRHYPPGTTFRLVRPLYGQDPVLYTVEA